MTLIEFYPIYFELSHEGESTVARFKYPRLTEDENLEQLGHELFSLVEQYDRRKVVLDLSSVELLTSSVLGKFITLHRKLHRQQGRLVLCSMTPQVREVMRMSRLIDYFRTTEDLPSALLALENDEG